MGTEAPETVGKKNPPPPPPQTLPLPPALFVVRAHTRPSRVADLGGAAVWPGPPDTPPRLSPVTVPFLWEEAPGKPKPPPPRSDDTSLSPTGAVREDVVSATCTTTPAAGAGGDHDTGGGADEARPAPLKLPPRLQRVASAKHLDGSISPRTVLDGPYYYGCAGGGKRPPRRTASGRLAAFRRMPSAGVGLFSRSKAATAAAGTKKNKNAGHQDHLSAAAPEAPWCSPAASSASSLSSSSSLSTSCFGDDHRRLADGRQDGSSEEDECGRGSVRIMRFRRNRSLPSMTTSHLWASIRKSVKQIIPWS